jgi:hypothetical protein
METGSTLRASRPSSTRPGTTFVAFGETSTLPTVPTAVPYDLGPLRRDLLDGQHELACGRQRVGPPVHRGGTGVVGLALDDDVAVRDAGDVGDDAGRDTRRLQDGVLLDVEFEPRVPLAGVEPSLSPEPDVVEGLPERHVAVGQQQRRLHRPPAGRDRRPQ